MRFILLSLYLSFPFFTLIAPLMRPRRKGGTGKGRTSDSGVQFRFPY